MTKENPNRLCKECLKFDYEMNRKGGSSSDVFVVCDHEEEHPEYDLISVRECLEYCKTHDVRVVHIMFERIVDELEKLNDRIGKLEELGKRESNEPC